MQVSSILSSLKIKAFCWLFIVVNSTILVTGCGVTEPKTDTYHDSAPHTSGFVTVASGVRLHYLNFGGTGDTLLLLAGSGNSAHIYDLFAPLLTDHFHVIALTRRGYGESSQPASGYDTKTLAEDILVFLDSLGVQQADIVGHSLAGVEMTRFACDHPERVKKLVFLDAAYDWAMQAENTNLPNPPTQPQATSSDVSSPAAFAAYWARIVGIPVYPEADIRATNVFSSNGQYVGPVTPSTIAIAFATGAAAAHPDYANVQTPALAIYTVPDSVKDMFPWIVLSPSEMQSATTFLNSVQPMMAAQRDNFRSKAPHGTVVEMHGVPHFFFLLDPNSVANEIRSFLLAP